MISIKITKKFNALVDLDHAYLKNYHWIVRRIGNTNYAFRKAYGKYFAWNMSWDVIGLPEVIQPFTEEPKVDPNVISRDEYFRMFQLMKQDGLSDEEIEGNLKGVRIAEDEKATIN